MIGYRQGGGCFVVEIPDNSIWGVVVQPREVFFLTCHETNQSLDGFQSSIRRFHTKGLTYISIYTVIVRLIKKKRKWTVSLWLFLSRLGLSFPPAMIALHTSAFFARRISPSGAWRTLEGWTLMSGCDHFKWMIDFADHNPKVSSTLTQYLRWVASV